MYRCLGEAESVKTTYLENEMKEVPQASSLALKVKMQVEAGFQMNHCSFFLPIGKGKNCHFCLVCVLVLKAKLCSLFF
jgi:hypothetical protein